MGSGRKLRKWVCAPSLLLIGAIFGAALVQPAPVRADYQAGVTAYQTGDFRGAYEQWLPLAQQGDATAQNALGALYDHGLGVGEDHVKAAYWYEKAAKQGFPMAMRNLGTLYANGNGVPRDLDQAKTWLQKAADAGDTEAGKRLSALTVQAPPPPANGGSNIPTKVTKTSAVEPQSMRGGHDLTTEDITAMQPGSGASSEPAPPPITNASAPPPSGVTAASGDNLADVPSAVPSVAPAPAAPATGTESATPGPTSEATPAPAPAESTATEATPPAPEAAATPTPTPAPTPEPAPAPTTASESPTPAANAGTTESGLPKFTAAQPDNNKTTARKPSNTHAAEEPAVAAPVAQAAPAPSAAEPATSDADATTPASPTTQAMTTKTEPLQLAPASPTPQAVTQSAPTPPAAPTTPPAPTTTAEPTQTATTAAPTPAPVPTPAPAPTPVAPTPAQAAAMPVATTPAQVAAVAPPAPEPDNWLLGKWQGPTLGCPPGGGVEFTASQSFTYYKGKISVTLPVSYRVEPDSVTVSTVGPDGISQDYVYQRTGPDSMIIVSIPPTMPRSLLGAAHRRCGAAPLPKTTQQATLQAPVAVYPNQAPALSNDVTPPVPSTTNTVQTPAQPPVAAPAAPSMAPAITAPKPKPIATPAPVPTPAPEPTKTVETKPEAKPAPTPPAAEATQTAEAPAAPTLPKSTTPASTAKPKAEEQPKAAAAESAPAAPTEEAATTPPAPMVPTPAPAETSPPAPAEPAPPPAPANDTEQKGWDALNAGNADQAIAIWEPLAKGGNTGLAVNVADMYEFGQKLPQDYGKAAQWYEIAAGQGDGYAQYQIGRAYTRGTGVSIDRVQAYKWLTLAMQSLSNAEALGKTGKASKMEIETALNDIVGAMSQEEMTKAAQMVKQYDDQHKIPQ